MFRYQCKNTVTARTMFPPESSYTTADPEYSNIDEAQEKDLKTTI